MDWQVEVYNWTLGYIKFLRNNILNYSYYFAVITIIGSTSYIIFKLITREWYYTANEIVPIYMVIIYIYILINRFLYFLDLKKSFKSREVSKNFFKHGTFLNLWFYTGIAIVTSLVDYLKHGNIEETLSNFLFIIIIAAGIFMFGLYKKYETRNIGENYKVLNIWMSPMRNLRLLNEFNSRKKSGEYSAVDSRIAFFRKDGEDISKDDKNKIDEILNDIKLFYSIIENDYVYVRANNQPITEINHTEIGEYYALFLVFDSQAVPSRNQYILGNPENNEYALNNIGILPINLVFAGAALAWGYYLAENLILS